MILFTILLIVALATVIVGLVPAILAGAGFLVIFGDLIVCALLVYAIVMLFTKKKK